MELSSSLMIILPPECLIKFQLLLATVSIIWIAIFDPNAVGKEMPTGRSRRSIHSISMNFEGHFSWEGVKHRQVGLSILFISSI